MSFIILNGLINVSQIGYAFPKEIQREIESILAVVIIIKCLYFMKLVDKMAPFINMISLIFYGIKTFMIMLFISVFWPTNL